MTKSVYLLASIIVLASVDRQSHASAQTGGRRSSLRVNSEPCFPKSLLTPITSDSRKPLCTYCGETGRLLLKAANLPLATRAGSSWTDRRSAAVLQNAVTDFQDYLKRSMQVTIALDARESLAGSESLTKSIVVATRDQLPGCGTALNTPKGYEIAAAPERLIVCGYDERGAMFGLFNMEERMNLREAPYVPANLKTTRNSLQQTRMVQSWMGWMDFPDTQLAHMAHHGFDSVFASVYTNPNGDRTTADNSTDFYARLMFRVRNQDPARVHDLINRAKRFGMRVYTPIIYQYMGTPESEAGLRQVVRDILKDFPDIQGYVLLTEGFLVQEVGRAARCS